MEELTGLDARFLYSETPTAHMHTIKVLVVDVDGRAEPLTPETLANALAERLDRMPGFRRRVVSPRHPISHPVWIETPLELADHIRWCRLDAPGDRVKLAAEVAEIAGTPLRRDRPLWEIVVVQGLAEGKLAFVVKLHHALADGVAAAAMLLNVFEGDAQHAVIESAHPETVPSPGLLNRFAWRNRIRRVGRLPGLAARNIIGLVSVGRFRHGGGTHPPTLFSGPRSSINVSLSDRRTFAVTDLPMGAVREICGRQKATVNDVFLAVCGGALRRHLGSDAAAGRGLVAGVPIGTPGDRARLTGNHLDHMLVGLRTDLEDPIARLDAIAAGSTAAMAERAALGPGLFEDRAGHTPPVLYPLAIRLWAATRLANRLRPPLNLIVSNVAGPRYPLRLEGGVVSELWSVGPILEGIGLNLTAWSYDGVLHVSALGCPESLPDPWRLMTHIDAALAELVEASRRAGQAPHSAEDLIGAVDA